jgi:hypothetical protein
MVRKLTLTAALAVLALAALADPASAADAPETWAFAPARDAFSADALLDLRDLNDQVAGAKGWIRANEAGDFVRGDGSPIRFWAINSNVERQKPWQRRPRWAKDEPDLAHHARWLAKRGVNMTRCHTHINPDPKTQKLTDVNMAECEYIWRTVGTVKDSGIYVTISPYWANTMKSDDGRWGTDWQGRHHGLLFFDEKLQDAYKAWLKTLFTTPTPLLGGKTLAQEPALAIFQIQNEDSLLFWTVNNLKGGPRERLGRLFADWAKKKYGSLDKALAAWKNQTAEGDRPEEGVLDFLNIWFMTEGAFKQNQGDTPRCHDQVAFFTETMLAFNKMIEDYIHDELGCPVLVNAGNWRTADTTFLNDAERYSYTANEVLAVNRYFGGVHLGEHRGWAIINGDQYTSDSVLTNDPLGFPLNVKQAVGRPMLVTESSWVFPNEFAAEAPFLVAAYGSLTGFDAYYWFATGTDEWTPPQSANGYLPSQGKWICATPDMLALFPAASLAFRKGYIARAEPVVVEHRSLQSMWQLDRPVIAEESGFDPNRDTGDMARRGETITAIDPYAFFVGPVEVAYDSDPAKTGAEHVEKYIRDVKGGRVVRSITGQLELNTADGYCTLNAPKAQGVAAHFARRGNFSLADVDIRSGNDFGSVMLVSLDDQPLKTSKRILAQVGTQCRPTGWTTAPTTIKTREGETVQGKVVKDYGGAPWQVECPDVRLTVRNAGLTEAVVLDMNGNAVKTLKLEDAAGARRLVFPRDAVHVILR